MTRRPSFSLYHGDFLAQTQLMTLAGKGAHISLLCSSWEHGPIPDDPTVLCKAMTLGADDPPFDRIWAEVRREWTMTPAGWVNERLERSRVERDRFVAEQSRKGKLGGRRRKPEESRGFHLETAVGKSRGFHPENAATTTKTATKHAAGDIAGKAGKKPRLKVQTQPDTRPAEKPDESLPSPSPSPDLQTPSPSPHTQRERARAARSPRASLTDERFDQFWKAYPNRVARAQAEKVWQALKVDDGLLARMLEALAWQTRRPEWVKDSGRYIPHPAKWLTAQRWEDEPVAVLDATDRAWNAALSGRPR